MHVFLILLVAFAVFRPGRHHLLSVVAGAVLGCAVLAALLLPEGGNVAFLLAVFAFMLSLCMLPFGTARGRVLTGDKAWDRREGFFGGRG